MKKVLFMVLACTLVLTTACGKKDEETNNKPAIEGEVANTNSEVIKDVTIDGLTIQNVTVIYDSKTGDTIYSADVVNTTDEEIYVKSFDMKFMDVYGNEITTLSGYVLKSLGPGEQATMTAGTGLNLSDATSIEYTRNN